MLFGVLLKTNILQKINFKFYSSININFSIMKYLGQQEAIQIDVELFNDYKFDVVQLMELAGLSVSHSIAKCYPVQSLKPNKVLIAVGPGNNGGDGLVAARHLTLMGYGVSLFYPRRTEKLLYQSLLHQCVTMGIELLEICPTQFDEYALVVDALFGFSFKPPVREEFLSIMQFLMKTDAPIASIDVPSGWDVEKGPSHDSITPSLLISLTAPKMCAMAFKGNWHFLGGRFVPKALSEKHKLELPIYPSTESCVKLN